MLVSKEFHLNNSHKLAYTQHLGKSPGVIYLHGLMSTMNAKKAIFLEQCCIDQKRSFIRFDYFGHGNSSGNFQDGNIGVWLDNVLTILDNLTTGPQILVGSSLGGWLMLLAALARPKRITGLLGIAASVDFTERLLWQNFSSAIKQELETNGIYYMPSNYGEPYPITMQLINEARTHLLLQNNNKINISCPISLVHGTGDTIVPWRHSMSIAEHLISDQVSIIINKHSSHSFSSPQDLQIIKLALQRLY